MKKYIWTLLTFAAFTTVGCNTGVSTSQDAEQLLEEVAEPADGEEAKRAAEMTMYKGMHDKYDVLHQKMEKVMADVNGKIASATDADKTNLTLKLGTIKKIDDRLHVWHKAYENIDMGEGHDHDHGDHEGHDHAHDHGSGGNLKLFEFPEQQRKLILNSLKEELEKMNTELAAAI